MLMMLALSGRSGPARGQLMLLMLDLCRSGPARGQLMLLMLALRGSGAARGPTDADDARLVGPLRPSKGPADAADARFVRLRRSKGPN